MTTYSGCLSNASLDVIRSLPIPITPTLSGSPPELSVKGSYVDLIRSNPVPITPTVSGKEPSVFLRASVIDIIRAVPYRTHDNIVSVYNTGFYLDVLTKIQELQPEPLEKYYKFEGKVSSIGTNINAETFYYRYNSGNLVSNYNVTSSGIFQHKVYYNDVYYSITNCSGTFNSSIIADIIPKEIL